jgi:acetyl esterase/lipase
MNEFSYDSGPRHKLDLYWPRRAGHASVVIFFYGGRWRSGRKNWYRLIASTLVAHNYVVVIPDYRLYPEVVFPNFLRDAARAFRWTKDSIESFGGDPNSIFVMGHSAGAYISAMLALDAQWLDRVGLTAQREVAGLIGVAGPYDFLPLKDPKLIRIFGGAQRRETQPISFVSGRKPPTLLLTGNEDAVVDPGNSDRLAEQLQTHGNTAKNVGYPHLGHVTILAGLLPGLCGFFPIVDVLSAFIREVKPAHLQTVQNLRRAAQ